MGLRNLRQRAAASHFAAEPLEQRMLLSISLQSVSATVNEGKSFSFPPSAFDAGYSNPGGPALASVKITALPTHGTLNVAGSAANLNQVVSRGSLSTLVYTPATNYVGSDNFDWNASDGSSYAAATAKVNLAIAALPHLSVSGSSLMEGDSGSSNLIFTISRNGDWSTAFSVNYSTMDGTALAGVDYTTTKGTLKFAAYQTTATVSVPVFGNNIDQPNRTFTLQLSRATVPAQFTTANFFNLGSSLYSVAAGDFNWDGRADVAVAGNDGTLGILLSDAPSVVLDAATATGTIVDDDAPVTLNFAAGNGQSSLPGNLFAANLAVFVRNAAGGFVKSVPVTFTAPASGAGGTFAGGLTSVIVNSDASGIATASAFTANVVLGSYSISVSSGTVPSLSFNLHNVVPSTPPCLVGSVDATVNESGVFSFQASCFEAGFTDLSGQTLQSVRITSLPAHGTLTLSGSAVSISQTIARGVLANLRYTPTPGYSGTDAFGWNAFDGLGYAATASQVNLTIAPLVHLSVSPGALASGASNMIFTLTRSGDTSTPFRVNYATVNGTAIAGTDYTSTSGTATFTANQTTAAVTVPVLGNTIYPTTRTFTLKLSNAAVSMPFAPGQSYVMGSHLWAGATGDFNGDGTADLVTANYDTASVSILMGNGNGSFQSAVNYAVGQSPMSVAVGDFNGDGKADLAVGNVNGSSSVSVLLGNGNGSFQSAVNYAVGQSPMSVAVGDFNGDGKADLATANNSYPGSVSLLLGNGNGTFRAAVNYAVNAGQGPYCVAAGDFDGDGNADLVTANYTQNSVSILLGNANGTLQAVATYAMDGIPCSVAVADFNRDGKLDLAAASGSDLRVLLGNGNGTLQAAVHYAVSSAPYSVAVADLNGDGRADLISNSGSSGTLSVLLGNGNGTFQPAVNYVVGLYSQAVAMADFDADGKLDLLAVNYTDSISLLRGNGNGTFQAATNYGLGSLPSAVVVGDCNGDGKADVVTANNQTRGVSVLLSNGNGTFQPAVTYVTGAVPESVGLGDFNGDGKEDIVTANDGGIITGLLGNGDGTYQAAITCSVGLGVTPDSIAIGDFNGDGRLDLAAADAGVYPSYAGTISVALGNGDGTFQAAANYAVGKSPYSLKAGDFNGDGRTDLATANFRSGSVSVLLSNGDGTFQPAMNEPVGTNPGSVAVGDFNGDGKLDLAADTINFTGPGTTVSILLSNGNGSFQAAMNSNGGPPSQSSNYPPLLAGDFSGDGQTDLVVVSMGALSVMPGNGNGTFQTTQTYTPSRISSAAPGDFNGDGRMDLAGTAGGYSITLLLGNAPSVVLDTSTATGTIPLSLAVSASTLTLPAVPVGSGVVRQTFSTLTIDSTGKLIVSSRMNADGSIDRNDRCVIVAPSTFSDLGMLDLGGNDMIVRSGILANLTSLIRNGAMIPAADASGRTGLCILPNNISGVTVFSSFDGVSVGPGDVLIRTRYFGDANCDGKVDGTDYTRVDAGFGSGGALTGWANGDFNYDGFIDGSDYSLIDGSYGANLTALPSSAIATPSAAIAPTIDKPAKTLLPQAASVFASSIIDIQIGDAKTGVQEDDLLLGRWRGREGSRFAPDLATGAKGIVRTFAR